MICWVSSRSASKCEHQQCPVLSSHPSKYQRCLTLINFSVDLVCEDIVRDRHRWGASYVIVSYHQSPVTHLSTDASIMIARRSNHLFLGVRPIRLWIAEAVHIIFTWLCGFQLVLFPYELFIFTMSKQTLRLIAEYLPYVDLNSQCEIVYATKHLQLDSLFKRCVSPLYISLNRHYVSQQSLCHILNLILKDRLSVRPS